MLYQETRNELKRRDVEIVAGGSRTHIVNALVWASPTDPADTFADFVRLGRLRRMVALGEGKPDLETLRDLEERFS